MTCSRSSFALSLTLLLVLGGRCDSAEGPAPPVFARDALSDASYNLVGLDGADEVVLLGELSFRTRQENSLSGSWEMLPWGEQEGISGLPGSGSFSGMIHGDIAIIQMNLSEGGESLGLVAEGFQEERLVGSLSLLPGSTFEGRFEAMANP